MQVSAGDLAVLHLQSLGGVGTGRAERAYTVAGICEAIGRDADAHSLTVLSTLADLVDDGLLEELVRPVEGVDGERSIYNLTEEGVDHARSLREDLSETSVVLREGGDERELPLADAAATLEDESPLVTALVEYDRHGAVTLGDSQADPFVGQDRELSLLEDVVWRSSAGPTGAVIDGPTGIGKTTLAMEFAARVRDQGGRVLSASGERTRTDPFGLFRQLFDPVEEDSPFATVQQRSVDADSYEQQRQSLFSNVLEHLETLAAAQPTLVVLDDIEWATPASLDLLTYLVDLLEETSLRLVCCYSPAAIDDESVATAVEDLTERPGIETITVDPLSRTDVAQLAGRVLDTADDIPPTVVDRLYDQSGGNPLFVTGLLRHLQEETAVDLTDGLFPASESDAVLPDTVRAVVDARLSSLAESHEDVLAAAAVVGERVSLSVLEQMTGRSEATLREMAGTFVDAALWERVRAPEVPLSRTFRFESAVIQEAVLDDVAPDRRTKLHEQAARAILDTGLTVQHSTHATVARHYEQAGNTADALDHYWTASEHALEMFAHDAAIEHCERALDLAESVGEAEMELDVQERLVEIYWSIGEYDAATSTLSSVRDRTTDEDGQRRQRLARFAAGIANARGEYGTAIEEVTTALDVTGDPSSERCRLLAAKASAEIQQGEYDDAETTAEQLRTLAASLDAPALRARGTRQLGTIAQRQGEYEQARTHHQEALSAFQRVDDSHQVAEVRLALGSAAWRLSEYDRADDHYQAALEGYEAVGDRHGVADVHENMAIVAHKRGEYDSAEEYAREALTEYKRLEDRHSIASVSNVRAAAASARGRYEQANDHYQRALEGHREVGDRHGVAKAQNNLGSVAHKQGAYETARDYSRQAFESYQDIGDRLGVAIARINLAMIAADQGRYETALTTSQQVFETFQDIDDPRTGVIHLTRGTVARKRGAYDRAEGQLQTALEQFDAEGDGSRLAQVRTELGALARQRGDLEAAEDYLRDALETATAADNRHRIATCHSELGALARERGDVEATRRHLQDALAGFEAVGDRHGRSVVRLRRSRLAFDQGTNEQARDSAETACSEFEAVGSRHWAARARHDLGVIATASGDTEIAPEHWVKSVETTTEIGAVRDALETFERLVDCCLEQGDDERAREWCDRALDTLDEHADRFETVPAEEADWFRERLDSRQ